MRLYCCLLYILTITTFQSLYGQGESWALVKPHYENLLINSNNIIYIVAQQKKPVSVDQVSAKYVRNSRAIEIKKIDDYFTIRPDSAGRIMISIKVKNKVSHQFLRAIEIPAIALLSHHRSYDTIPPGEMKAQRGLYPQVENYGFDIKCSILGFDILKVSQSNLVSRATNKGETFKDGSMEILKSTLAGDLYLFYNIMCRCPGGNFPVRLEDVIIQIE